MDLSDQKQRLRTLFKARRNALSEETRLEAARFLSKTFFELPLARHLGTPSGIASYMSFASEFPTEAFHQTCFRKEIPLIIPYYTPTSKTYTWVTLSPNETLHLGHLNIPEPSSPRLADTAAIGAALIPGVAFDRWGGRIGYGAGIYDRLLLQLPPQVLRIAVAFEAQVSPEAVPQERHDVKMDFLITEQRWFDCRLERGERSCAHA